MTGLAQHKSLLEAAAFHAGVIFAIERNRRRLTQEETALRAGLAQTDISRLENGQPVDGSDAQIDRAFQEVPGEQHDPRELREVVARKRDLTERQSRPAIPRRVPANECRRRGAPIIRGGES